MPKPHSFDEKLKEAAEWEQKVSQSLVDLVVAEAWRLASREEQRDGVDVVVKLKKSTFDVKFRDNKYYLKGILIETVSVVEEGKPGWFYTSQADEIIYLWLNKERTGLMPLGFRVFHRDRRFREWFEEHKNHYREQYTSSEKDGKVWHSRFVVVPIEDFPSGTLQRFNVRVMVHDPSQSKLDQF